MKVWRELRTDPGAQYDHTITLDVSDLAPMITFGTNPGMGVAVTGTDSGSRQHRGCRVSKSTLQNALHYMGLTPGQAVLGQPDPGGVHWKLHERPTLGPAGRRVDHEGQVRRQGCPRARCARARRP